MPVAAVSGAAQREVVDPGWVTREELETRLAEPLGQEALEGEVKPASRKRQATQKFEAGAGRSEIRWAAVGVGAGPDRAWVGSGGVEWCV